MAAQLLGPEKRHERALCACGHSLDQRTVNAFCGESRHRLTEQPFVRNARP